MTHAKTHIATKTRFDMEEDIMRAWGTADNIKTLTELYMDCREPMSVDELWNKLNAIQEMHDIHMKRLWDTYLQSFQLDGYYDPSKQDEVPTTNNTTKAKSKKGG